VTSASASTELLQISSLALDRLRWGCCSSTDAEHSHARWVLQVTRPIGPDPGFPWELFDPSFAARQADAANSEGSSMADQALLLQALRSFAAAMKRSYDITEMCYELCDRTVDVLSATGAGVSVVEWDRRAQICDGHRREDPVHRGNPGELTDRALRHRVPSPANSKWR